MPVVSVLLVFHRDIEFLRPAIASVLAQTWRDFELILVDNGAGLSAADLGPAGRDSRLRWVGLPVNRGIAGGHNAGVAAAVGEFIAQMDYDDLMLPHRLKRQVAALRAAPALGLVGSGATTIDGSGRRIGREFCLVDVAEHRAYSEFHSGCIMPTFTGRTAVFREFDYREEFHFAGDFDFVARVAERHAIAAVPEVLLHYRRHAGQTTAVRRNAQVREECIVRLLTARRRRGGEERLAETLGGMQGRSEAGDLPAMHRGFAAWFLQERLAAQAVYQARRAIAARRTPALFWAGLKTLRLACALEPSARGFLSRFFFLGPVRALGLQNAGARMPERMA